MDEATKTRYEIARHKFEQLAFLDTPEFHTFWNRVKETVDGWASFSLGDALDACDATAASV